MVFMSQLTVENNMSIQNAPCRIRDWLIKIISIYQNRI